MAKREDRIFIRLECSECKRPNYTTSKNRRTTPDRLERRKFCPWCRCHRLHRETRIQGQG